MDEATVSAITGAINFTNVIVGIGTVFAAVILVKVAMIGGRKILSALR